LDEAKDIALVGLKRMVEKNKLEKIQNNLHMIDMPKQNQHIFFVANKEEIKQHSALAEEAEGSAYKRQRIEGER
jgi:Utp11 protein